MPAERTNTDDFPDDFFKDGASGLITTTDGIGFRVSDNDFADMNQGYADEFESFSKVKTFMSVGSAADDASRSGCPGRTPGLVNGFGIVFSDVDRAGAASITLYAVDGTNLGDYIAPVRSDAAGHSFVGAVYDRPLVGPGRGHLRRGGARRPDRRSSTDGGAHDLVITRRLHLRGAAAGVASPAWPADQALLGIEEQRRHRERDHGGADHDREVQETTRSAGWPSACRSRSTA